MDEEVSEEGGAVVVTNVYGDICFRKARRKRQKKLVREIFFDYANNTTLHGLSYTTKRGLSLVEKIFWLLTFIASLSICCYQIHIVFIKWKTSPVIVTVSEELVPVGKVPFPSVTICPQSKIKASEYNYTAEYVMYVKLLSNLWTSNESSILPYDKNFSMFDDVLHVCDPEQLVFNSFSRVFPKKNLSDASTVTNIVNLSTQKSDIFAYCHWRNKVDFGCHKVFKEVLTSEGVCFTINSLAEKDILRKDIIRNDFTYLNNEMAINKWSLDHGYSGSGPDVYPAPGKENGATPDLKVVMVDYVKEHDPLCNALNTGFKVYVHHPADLPQSSLYYYAVLNKQVSSMALSFSVLNTSESLKRYDPEIRQCYFPGERYLKYFKIYTANNCKIECLTNYTYRRCGCVAFYMPHETKNKICTISNVGCVTTAKEKLVAREANETNKKCRCLPACNSIDYEAEILKTDFNLKNYIKADTAARNYTFNVNGTQFSKLEMYFKRSRFVSMRRSELFGLTDFLANIGGLLGLFLGFSFLSLVELFYFATLRICCTLKKDLKEEKIQRRNTIKIPQKY